MKFIKLEPGCLADLIYQEEKWQEKWYTFSFLDNQWITMKQSHGGIFMHHDSRWPSLMTFEETLKELENKFTEDVIIVYYDNHSFGALKKLCI